MTIQQPWWKEPTRQQWAAFSAAWVGWVLDAFDFMVYVLVTKQLMTEFGVGLAAVSGSITLTLLVRLAGGAIAGWMADRWGRKLPLMLSLVWFVAFDAAIFFSHSFTAIVIFRTLFGFGMGAQWAAGTALAMESLPERTRKIGSGILQAGWPIGVMLAAAVAYFVVDAHTWRPMFLVGAIPAILTLPLWFMFPSTRPAPRAAGTKKVSPLRELASPGVPKMLTLGAFVMTLGFIVYYGLQSQYPAMLQGELHLVPKTAFLHVILFNAGMLFGVIAAGVVAQRWGVIVALVTPALLMVPALPLYVGMVPGIGLAVGAVLGGALGVGYSGVTPVLTTSLFPARVRALAIGIVYHVGAFGAAFVPWLIPKLATWLHLPLSRVLMLVAGTALVAMSAAVLVLRRLITTPVEQRMPAPATDEPTRAAASPAADPDVTGPRELYSTAAQLVDRDVAKAAERSPIVG